jgi:pimeloyl-ACP methyl ester carboxylesterase
METVSPVEYREFLVGDAATYHRLSAKTRLHGAELIVFIHGIGDSKEDFDSVWQCPAFDRYALCAIDLIGFGDSSKPRDFSYDLYDHASACAEAISPLGYQRIHIVGHSVGGAVALLLATILAPKVVSFISIEGNLIAEDCGLITRRTAEVSLEIFEREQFEELVTKLRKQGLAKDLLDLKRCSPYAFYKTACSAVHWSDSGRLLQMFAELSAPKAYLYGEYNSGYPVLKRLIEIPAIAISRSGHAPMDDNPGEFYQRCAAFISSARC